MKMLIAQIKAAKEEQIKQILKDVMENSKIANNDSENLKMENYLLKDLNAELKNKNMILKELQIKEKELWKKNDSTGIITNKKTYSEIISGKIQKPKRIPRIMIKKKKKKKRRRKWKKLIMT